MSDTEPRKSRGELNLDRYRARLGFWQAIWATLITGGLAAAIPGIVGVYKARLESITAAENVELEKIKLRDKVVTDHDEYVSRFLSDALSQDIELRIRFSKYFSFVSSDDQFKEGWKLYADELDKNRTRIRAEIKEKETNIARLGASGNVTLEDQIDIANMKRDLQWDYAEANYAPIDTNVTTATVAPAQKTIPDLVEKRFTSSEFRDYIATVDFSGWQPKFAVVGNTGAPSLAQYTSFGETIRSRWIKNFGNYEAELGLSGTYHLIIDDKGIWVMNPLSRRGICSSSFNEKAICIEMVGNYEIGGDDFTTGDGAKVRANVIEALAIIDKKLSFKPSDLYFHSDDPNDHHASPGSKVNKADLVEAVTKAMQSQ